MAFSSRFEVLVPTVKHQMFVPDLNRFFCNLSELRTLSGTENYLVRENLDGNFVVPKIYWLVVIVLKFEHSQQCGYMRQLTKCAGSH